MTICILNVGWDTIQCRKSSIQPTADIVSVMLDICDDYKI